MWLMAGKSQASKDDVGKVLYNRGLFNAVIVSEAIRAAQAATGNTAITGADMRIGLEKFDLSEARLAEIGLAGFTAPIKGSCADHEGAGSVFLQQWNGSAWEKITDPIAPMTDVVRPAGLKKLQTATYLTSQAGKPRPAAKAINNHPRHFCRGCTLFNPDSLT